MTRREDDNYRTGRGFSPRSIHPRQSSETRIDSLRTQAGAATEYWINTTIARARGPIGSPTECHKWLRQHAAVHPFRHNPHTARGLTSGCGRMRPSTHFGTPLTQFVVQQGTPPKTPRGTLWPHPATHLFRHTSTRFVAPYGNSTEGPCSDRGRKRPPPHTVRSLPHRELHRRPQWLWPHAYTMLHNMNTRCRYIKYRVCCYTIYLVGFRRSSVPTCSSAYAIYR